MSKTIFRRIGGRIVPIRVERTVDTSVFGTKNVTYNLREGFKRVGEVYAQQSLKRPHRFVVGSHINPEYRKAGLGKEFYKKVARSVKQLGGRSLVGTTDNVEPIKKVRDAAGKTKAYKEKHRFGGTTHVTWLKKGKK